VPTEIDGSREYRNQDLCLDAGATGHWRIPEDQIKLALLRDSRFDSGYRIRDVSPFTSYPIVVCDPAKVVDPAA
jgi:hypothetical protein